MNQHGPIDVTVQISQTLRDLHAAGAGISCVGEPSSLQTSVTPPEPECSIARHESYWNRVCLRNDGAQPIIFDGLLLLQFSGPLRVGTLMGDQNVLIYLNSTQAMIVSLSLEFRNDAPARSIFHAAEIDLGTPTSLFTEWCKTISQTAALVTQSSRSTDIFTEILDQFQSITSHSFRLETVS